MDELLTAAATLPADQIAGTLVARVWTPGTPGGPTVAVVRDDGVFDLSHRVPTMADLINADDPVAIAHEPGRRLGDLAAMLANSAHDRRDTAMPYILTPVDLQALKASGVTF